MRRVIWKAGGGWGALVTDEDGDAILEGPSEQSILIGSELETADMCRAYLASIGELTTGHAIEQHKGLCKSLDEAAESTAKAAKRARDQLALARLNADMVSEVTK